VGGNWGGEVPIEGNSRFKNLEVRIVLVTGAQTCGKFRLEDGLLSSQNNLGHISSRITSAPSLKEGRKTRQFILSHIYPR